MLLLVSPTYCVTERRTVCRRFFFYALFHYNIDLDYVKYFCITFMFLCIKSYLFCGISSEGRTRCFYIIKLKEETPVTFCPFTSRAAPFGQTERAARERGRPRGRGIGWGYATTSHKIQATFCAVVAQRALSQNGDFVSGARADALTVKKAAQRAAVIRPRASVAVGVVAALCRSQLRPGQWRRLRAAANKTFHYGSVRVSLTKVFPCLAKERPPRMTVTAAPLPIIKCYRDRQGRTVFLCTKICVLPLTC